MRLAENGGANDDSAGGIKKDFNSDNNNGHTSEDKGKRQDEEDNAEVQDHSDVDKIADNIGNIDMNTNQGVFDAIDNLTEKTKGMIEG